MIGILMVKGKEESYPMFSEPNGGVFITAIVGY
jgi:hypothetical protein